MGTPERSHPTPLTRGCQVLLEAGSLGYIAPSTQAGLARRRVSQRVSDFSRRPRSVRGQVEPAIDSQEALK